MARLGNEPGKVGATAFVDVGVTTDGNGNSEPDVLVVVLPDGASMGRPMSVVESFTVVVYDVEVDEVVVARTWGASGRWVPGGTTVSGSVVSHRLDICTTAITNPATSASPTRPAARVAAGDRNHGSLSGGMAADTSRPGGTAPDRRLDEQ